MKNAVHHTILVAWLGCCLTGSAFANAPVVDESENFALFDEQLAAAERPDAFMLAQEDINMGALAQEDSDTDADTSLASNMDTHASEDNNPSFNKLQSLQQELNELRGQLEIQTHELQALKQQQLNFYNDLDTRLRSNNTTATSKQPHASNDEQAINTLPASTAPRGNPADEQISYLAAYELVKNKDFDKAVMAMKSFINHYPRGGYTANAHYWLGELYMVKKSYPDAIDQFKTVLQTFPASSKSSASSLKIGYALAESGQTHAARDHLRTVIHDYPDTHAAELAASKLETLNS
jgi:tol-pal system protein YbgF